MQYYKHPVRRPVTPYTDRVYGTSAAPASAPGPEKPTVSSNPLTGFPLGMAYVPYQVFEDLNEPAKALECGTLFRALYMPFQGPKRRSGV